MFKRLSISVSLILMSSSAFAAPVTATGKVVAVYSHQNPGCRQVTFRKDDGGFLYLRMPNSSAGVEDITAATSLTALVTGYTADVNYDPAVSACGPEPVINWISIHAPGF